MLSGLDSVSGLGPVGAVLTATKVPSVSGGDSWTVSRYIGGGVAWRHVAQTWLRPACINRSEGNKLVPSQTGRISVHLLSDCFLFFYKLLF